MKKILIVLLALTFNLTSYADTLPKNLIALSSAEGTKLFNRSYAGNYFWPLNLQFLTQQTRTYCSIASSVMVLNALHIAAPEDPIYKPYNIFTQDNFFTSAVEKILPMSTVKKQGATLDQISQALRTYSVSVKTIHADELNINKFRMLAKQVIHDHAGYIIVNFIRTGIGEEGFGHMSPLAAYDAETDRFLLLDVARYRYPSVWVKTHDLWNAIHTVDKDANAYRGLLIVVSGKA